MPRLTNLDDDILRGIIFGSHLLNHDATTAHSKLLQLSGTEMFTIKQVEGLYQQIKRCQYKLGSTNRILLAENGVFRDQGIIELVQHMRCKMLRPNVVHEVLLEVTGKELYTLDKISSIYFHDRCFYNKNALRGLMLCLKSQGIGDYHAQLAEATKGDAWKQLNQPVFSLTDLQELNKEIEQGEYLEQQHSVRLWTAVRPYEIMESIVKYADTDSRISLQQTCTEFQHLVNRERIHFENLCVEFTGNYVKIQADSVISKVFRQVPSLPGCFISSHGKVWYDKTKLFTDEAGNLLKWISCRERLTITNLRLQSRWLVRLDGIRRMNVQHLCIRTSDLRNMELVLQVCQREHLKGIFSYVPEHPRMPFRLADNFQNIEVLATNYTFDDFLDLHRLKYLMFPIEETGCVDSLMEFKNNLLQNLTFREFILNFGPNEQIHHELNTRLGLNNEFYTENIEWARYYYPEPNEDKYILAASANQSMVFIGPGYVSRDEEHCVSRELESMATMSDRCFEQVDWKRDGLIEKEVEEMNAIHEEEQEELFSDFVRTHGLPGSA